MSDEHPGVLAVHVGRGIFYPPRPGRGEVTPTHRVLPVDEESLMSLQRKIEIALDAARSAGLGTISQASYVRAALGLVVPDA